jgi:hypothetical protein
VVAKGSAATKFEVTHSCISSFHDPHACTHTQEFHQASSARSLAAKDSLAGELEDIRRKLATTSMSLNVAEGRADSEERGKHAAEATLAKRQQQLAQVCVCVRAL